MLDGRASAEGEDNCCCDSDTEHQHLVLRLQDRTLYLGKRLCARYSESRPMMRIVLSRAWAALAVWCPPTLPKLMHKQTANDNLA